MQQALVRFGLNLPGGITGTYSIGTANSVRTFQRITGLPVTGIVDASTARALGVLVAPVRTHGLVEPRRPGDRATCRRRRSAR